MNTSVAHRSRLAAVAAAVTVLISAVLLIFGQAQADANTGEPTTTPSATSTKSYTPKPTATPTKTYPPTTTKTTTTKPPTTTTKTTTTKPPTTTTTTTTTKPPTTTTTTTTTTHHDHDHKSADDDHGCT